MQSNTNSASTTTSNKDNWQQRRYQFLRRHSIFSGESKEDTVDQADVNDQESDNEES